MEPSKVPSITSRIMPWMAATQDLENSKVRMVIDAGNHIVVLISEKNYGQTRPPVGNPVNIRIPSEAVEIFHQ